MFNLSFRREKFDEFKPGTEEALSYILELGLVEGDALTSSHLQSDPVPFPCSPFAYMRC